MAKKTKSQTFSAREERISAKIFNILANDQYLDSQLGLFTIDEKTLKGFFPREASVKTIVDVTSKLPLFNYVAGNITLTLSTVVKADITYTINGASSIKINGVSGNINGGTIYNVYLRLPNHSFAITVDTPTPLGLWEFKATKIVISSTQTRTMTPASVGQNGGVNNFNIRTV